MPGPEPAIAVRLQELIENNYFRSGGFVRKGKKGLVGAMMGVRPMLEIARLYSEYGDRVKEIAFSGHHLGIAVDVAASRLVCSGALGQRLAWRLVGPQVSGWRRWKQLRVRCASALRRVSRC